MQILWWTVTVILMLIGLVCTVMPLLPGNLIIFAAAFIHYIALGSGHSVSIPTLVVLGVLTLISGALDFVSGSLGAKWSGASKWGAFGGVIGAIAGLFFGLVGVFVGPLVGVLIGELLSGKGFLPAGKSTWGTFLGTTAGIVCNLAIGFLMIGWFFVAALWR